MALRLNTLAAFVGRITSADANYPWGSSKDETTTGAGDGTPYIKTRADDVFGMQQSFLSAAGLTPSGDPDTAVDSQYLDSIIGLLWYQFANYPIGARAIHSGRGWRAIAANGPKEAYSGAAQEPGNDSTYWVPEEQLTQNQISTNAKIVPIVTADSTPRSYPAGTAFSSGWTVGVALVDMTYVDGEYNAVSGTIYTDVAKEDGLEYFVLADFVGSVASINRVPRTAGVTVSDEGDTFRVTIDFSTAADVFSARLELGPYACMHELGETGGSGGAALGVFHENDQELTQDYTLVQGKNAGVFGPLTIADGVTVTVEYGSTLTVVGG